MDSGLEGEGDRRHPPRGMREKGKLKTGYRPAIEDMVADNQMEVTFQICSVSVVFRESCVHSLQEAACFRGGISWHVCSLL